ncbi:MAG TPA: ACP S-malonyltransferase [Polyangia bacterium]|jgi:[acyl-carrier-protein] S-malonyltransferase
MRAFLFPGQGSQAVGMGKALCVEFPRAREVFAAADDALGFGLSVLCFAGPEADLKLTANTQPAILTTSVAVLRVLEAETGLTPDVVAGHSLGEYSALVGAGALRFADAVRLTRLRGEAMQQAVPAGQGAMAAVMGAAPEVLEEACREAAQGQVVSPANFNGGGQIVIAGDQAAVDRALAILKAKGVRRAIPLPVSAPFHCALMQPAARRVDEALAAVEVGPLAVPVVSNVEAEPNTDAARVRELLVRQVTSPVRWEASVQRLAAMGVTEALEVGPGAVLAGLVKRIAATITVRSVAEPAQVREIAGTGTGTSTGTG